MKGQQTFQMCFSILHQIVTKGPPGCVLWAFLGTCTQWHNLNSYPTKWIKPRLRRIRLFHTHTTWLPVAELTPLYIKQTTILLSDMTVCSQECLSPHGRHYGDMKRSLTSSSLLAGEVSSGDLSEQLRSSTWVASVNWHRHFRCHAGRSWHAACCSMVMLPDRSYLTWQWGANHDPIKHLYSLLFS